MNRLTILGRVGKEFEAIGKVGVLSVGVKRDRKNDAGTYDSDWFRIKVFGETIKVIQNYVGVGDALLIDCKVQQHNWTDKDGIAHYDWDFIMERFEFVAKGQPKTPGATPSQKPITPAPVEAVNPEDDLPF